MKAGRGGEWGCWTGPQEIPPSPAGISLEASGNTACPPAPAYITLHGHPPPLEQALETRPTCISCEPPLQCTRSPHPVLVPGVHVADDLHQVLGVDAADSLLGVTGRQHRRGDHLPSSGQPHPQGTECVQSSSQDLPAGAGTTATALPRSERPVDRPPPGVLQGSGRPPWEQGDRTVCMTQGHSCYTQGTCPAQGAGRTRVPEPVGGALPWKPLP